MGSVVVAGLWKIRTCTNSINSEDHLPGQYYLLEDISRPIRELKCYFQCQLHSLRWYSRRTAHLRLYFRSLVENELPTYFDFDPDAFRGPICWILRCPWIDPRTVCGVDCVSLFLRVSNPPIFETQKD